MPLSPIYLDNNSTTRPHQRVLDRYIEIESNFFGNPSSAHFYGWQAKEILEIAREQVARLVGAPSYCVVFTGSATEANSLLIQGYLKKNLDNSHRKSNRTTPRIITTKIEHSSIIKNCTEMSLEGRCALSFLEIDQSGFIIPSKKQPDLIDEDKKLLILQAANNEFGTMQNLNQMKEDTSIDDAFIFSDFVQCAGKIPFDLSSSSINAISISAHKMHGPKGIGALIFKNEESKNQISSLFHGGTQEFGLRPGTSPLALIAAFGEACDMARENLNKTNLQLIKLTKLAYTKLTSSLDNIRLVGPPIDSEQRLPGNLGLIISGISGSELCNALANSVAISTGSACSTGSHDAPNMLTQLGMSKEEASNFIRIGISSLNTAEEIETACERLISKIEKLRNKKI